MRRRNLRVLESLTEIRSHGLKGPFERVVARQHPLSFLQCNNFKVGFFEPIQVAPREHILVLTKNRFHDFLPGRFHILLKGEKTNNESKHIQDA